MNTELVMVKHTNSRQIGLALSGGGVRATAFHLGMLLRLADQNLLEDVHFISTVSGGSLCAALIFAAGGMEWPNSSEFRTRVIPFAQQALTGTNLQFSLIARTLLKLGILRSRAHELAKILAARWGIDASLRDLPTHPRWIINATCYETGKNWRFERKRMGDYVFGYELDPDFPVAQAVAASAGFPGLIGPITLHTSGRTWVNYSNGNTAEIKPQFTYVHLWDGGVYDNLGVEPLFKPNGKYRPDVDFLIVSDASGFLRSTPYVNFSGVPQALRLVGIATSQVRALRVRTLHSYFSEGGLAGCYLRLGTPGPEILRSSDCTTDQERGEKLFLSLDGTQMVAQIGTHIRRLTDNQYYCLFRHGYDVANATLHAYARQSFPLYRYTAISSVSE